ncbi:MAG: lipopolysaccharide biosynthesis protein [Paludibacteraceae bacterium]|nr:lipopolysaccharide biosynthesis protein [Paludibacteraceae bacterium]
MGIIIRQSIKGTFVNYIGVLLGIFVQFYVVTKYIDPAVIGLTKVFYELAFLLSGLALMGLSSSAIRFFPYFKNEKNGDNGFLFYHLMVPTIGVLIISVLYLCLKAPILTYFSAKSPEFEPFFYWVIALMVVLTFWQVGEIYANIHMRIAIPKAVREIGMRCCMLVLYLAFAFGYIDVRGLIGGFIISYALCMLTTGVYSLHIGGTTLKHDWAYLTPELKQKFGRYTGFMIISALAGNIMAQLDSFMLSGVKGMYSVGIYVIAIYMAEVVNMPSRNISPIAAPLASEAMKNNDIRKAQDLYQQVSVHQCLATSFLLLLVWANFSNIYSILPNGDVYAEGKWAVLLLGLSKLVYATLNFGNTLIAYSKYYYWTLFITVFLTALTICTNLYFIPKFGLTGAALATLITCLISYSYQQYIVQRKLHANPFTWAHLKIAAIVIVLFGLNWLIPSLLHVSPWLDLAVRSTILVIIGSLIVYYSQVSIPLNHLIQTKLLKR